MRAGALEIRPVTSGLIVYRGAKRFELWDGPRLVRAGKVAVREAPGAETPLGLFYVTWKFSPSIDPNSGDSRVVRLRDERVLEADRLAWRGGIVGMHGTPWPNLLGQAVSHGCVRVHNDNIEFPA